jgi:restriction system protein
MAIPDYQTVMLPLLRYAGDGVAHTLREAVDSLAAEFRLTPDERSHLLPSGTQATFTNRVGWAQSYMKQAGLIESPKRGQFQITEEGQRALASNPSRIDVRFLERYPSFQQFRARAGTRKRRTVDAPPIRAGTDDQTPEEQIEGADQTIRAKLERDLLDRVKTASPTFFERIVLQLLVAMGYGGSLTDAAEHLGRSGDDGVDGVINEDRLGLDVVHVQAKRWAEAPVRRPDVQSFAGSLEGQRSRKGVFITTSHFTRDALEYVSRIEKRIVLIDGEELARLMIDHRVGVSELRTYSVLRLDDTYFDESST